MRRLGFRRILPIVQLTLLATAGVVDALPHVIKQIIGALNAPALLVAAVFLTWLEVLLELVKNTLLEYVVTIAVFGLCVVAIWYPIGRRLDRHLGWVPAPLDQPPSTIRCMLAWLTLATLAVVTVYFALWSRERLYDLFLKGFEFPLAVWSAFAALVLALKLRQWWQLARPPG